MVRRMESIWFSRFTVNIRGRIKGGYCASVDDSRNVCWFFLQDAPVKTPTHDSVMLFLHPSDWNKLQSLH